MTRPLHRLSAASALGLAMALIACAGCSTEMELHPRRDPGGGALNDSVACVYDATPDRLWYVEFIHLDGLLSTLHRHEAGIHLFVRGGDMAFYSRSSGPGEVLDVMGQTFSLAAGTVFLCDVRDGTTRVVQLPIPPVPCHGEDPESISKAIYELSRDPRIASFLEGEAQLRLRANWEVAKNRKQTTESGKN